MHSFRAAGDARILYLDETPLFQKCRTKDEVTSKEVLRACGRLAAEALDARESVDGTPGLQRKMVVGSVSGGSADLVSSGASGQVD